MSSLTLTTLKIKSSNLNGESSLPPTNDTLSYDSDNEVCLLDEEDGLYTWYGEYLGAFPYRMQNLYDRSVDEKNYKAVVLENQYLKAILLPELGGKLWSLFDKEKNKELLFRNSIVRPCNLAIRNAWTSGGVEWNCGFRGHSPYTCDKIFTAETKLSDGTPVLRFYWFERVRAAIIQMDIFLPDDSRFLIVRNRITNPGREVEPMYWWSNIAVVEKEGDRVIVPAVKSYTTTESAGRSDVEKIDIPLYKGRDISYPLNNIVAKDYFFTTKENYRHYVTQLDKDGYGLVQTSTSRLIGRKLFIWGNSQGGRKWQNFLTQDNETGSYDEIQCGLAHSQYECLPMPPHSCWEWAEAYGALKANPKLVHGDWSDAQKEAERALSNLLPEETLENILENTKTMAKSPAKTIFQKGDGWGALELLRKEKAGSNLGLMNSHLDFGEITDTVKAWEKLVTEGTVGIHSPDDVPMSYIARKEWIKLLKNAINGKDAENWYAYYELGCTELAFGHWNEAEKNILKSLELQKSPWALYAKAILLSKQGKKTDAAETIKQAVKLRHDDISILREANRLFNDAGLFEETIKNVNFYALAKRDNRCLYYLAEAYTNVGKLDDAEKILCGEDGKHCLIVYDMREGELSITDLWFKIQRLKGIPNDKIGEPPYDLDFRMMARKDEL